MKDIGENMKPLERRDLEQQLQDAFLSSWLDGRQVEALISNAAQMVLPKGATVIRQGERSNCLYVVLSGKVGVFVECDEEIDRQVRKVFVLAAGAGEVIGEISLLTEDEEPASVSTMEPSVLLRLPREVLSPHLEKEPGLALFLMEVISRRSRATLEALKQQAFCQVYERLARVLLELSEQDGERRMIRERVTHQYLANIIGASRVMVTRLLKELEFGQYIGKDNGRIVLNRALPQRY